MTDEFSASCACGQVQIRATGTPIVASACYCADCQKGGGEIEALLNAVPVRDDDGGTAYLLFPKDRFACIKGQEFLKPDKLKPSSITNRVVATCCNSGMFMNFDKGPYWVSAYRRRFQGDVPPIEMRICTKARASDAPYPDNAPRFSGQPIRLMGRLLSGAIAMALRG